MSKIIDGIKASKMQQGLSCSMKKCRTLDEILEFIRVNHNELNTKGVYCLKLFRRSDGIRVPFEEMKGVRILDFTVYNPNTVIVQQHSHGVISKGKALTAFDSTLYLHDLIMVNVYDYSAEFFTDHGIDFTYLQQSKNAKMVMLAEWVHDVSRILRAQWFKDEETEKLLSEVGLGRVLQRYVPMGRHLDLDEI